MGTHQSILMPKLGLTMTEGVIAEWKIAPGDSVKAGDVIYIVETDKISNEIEASEDAIVEALLVREGDVVPVGAVVATFVSEGGTAAESPPPPPASAPQPDEIVAAPTVAAPIATAPGSEGRIIATPLARRMAADAGIAIGSVKGGGPRGRIMADDVSAAARGRAPGPAVRPAPAAAPASAVPAPSPAPPPGSERGVVRPIGQFQKVTARRLTEAKRDIPHFYVFAEADVTELLALRTRLNADAGFARLTVNHFLITAVARALAAVPEANIVWVEEGIFELARVDVGMAVEGPKGLVAPVLKDIGGCDVDAVAAAATALVERARAGRLSQAELQGGATSVSNVGMFGATGLIPIVNPGQSSILGVGRNRPAFLPDEQGQPRLRQILNLTLSCDHRVIDGALAARFLQSIQNGLEAPLTLLRRPMQGSVE